MRSYFGLKGCLEQYKGCIFIYKIKHIFKELKWAFQRAWRGYDSRDIWGLNDRFIDRLIILLKDYKENCHCLWWCPEGYDWSKICEKDKVTECYFFTSEQMEAIIDTLIFYLQMCDEDFVEKQLFGSNVFDDGYEVGSRTLDDIRKIQKIRKQNQDAAIKLLGKLMDNLWD